MQPDLHIIMQLQINSTLRIEDDKPGGGPRNALSHTPSVSGSTDTTPAQHPQPATRHPPHRTNRSSTPTPTAQTRSAA